MGLIALAILFVLSVMAFGLATTIAVVKLVAFLVIVSSGVIFVACLVVFVFIYVLVAVFS